MNRWFRLVALLEGLSFLLLLFLAMPLKYAAGQPLAVKILGPAHGVLFILYAVLLYDIILSKVWSRRTIFFAIAAAFLPAGTLIFDRWLARAGSARGLPAASEEAR
jgi:integral membrane protein